jgi:putative membrane protein
VSADYVPGLGARAVLAPEADPFADTAVEPAIVPRRRIRWGRFLLAGLSGLVALAVGLAVDALIRDLFSRSDALGWVGVALAAIAAFAVLAIATREIVGLLRIRAVTAIHAAASEAIAADDRNAARKIARELIGLYERRPETARSRAALAGHMAEIIDGRDLIGLAETEIMLPIDETARRLVLSAAKRVALVTTVSPRALVDVLFVAFQVLRLIRQLATLYAGRPGTLGFLRLTRAAVAHLAVTGGIAACD